MPLLQKALAHNLHEQWRLQTRLLNGYGQLLRQTRQLQQAVALHWRLKHAASVQTQA